MIVGERCLFAFSSAPVRQMKERGQLASFNCIIYDYDYCYYDTFKVAILLLLFPLREMSFYYYYCTTRVLLTWSFIPPVYQRVSLYSYKLTSIHLNRGRRV